MAPDTAVSSAGVTRRAGCGASSHPGIFPLEMAPNRIWGGAQGTGKGQGDQSVAEPGPGSSGGIMERFLPSVSDWYLIFPMLERSLCWLVPLVTWYILSSSFASLIQLTGIPLHEF